MNVQPIKKGFPLGPLPAFLWDGTPFDWTGISIPSTEPAGLPIYGLGSTSGLLFVPRVLLVDASIPFDTTGYEDRIAAIGLNIGRGTVAAPENLDDPNNEWSRELLSGTPTAGDGSSKDPAQYIGGRLMIVLSAFGGGDYVSEFGNYASSKSPDTRPLCSMLPPTGSGATFSGGQPAIDNPIVPATLNSARIAADSAALTIIAARFDRVAIYFVQQPPGTITKDTVAQDQVVCRANDEVGTTILVDSPPETTTEYDSDAVERAIADLLFGAVASDVVNYVASAPSVSEALAFFEAA
jgi:hypothetical protein